MAVVLRRLRPESWGRFSSEDAELLLDEAHKAATSRLCARCRASQGGPPKPFDVSDAFRSSADGVRRGAVFPIMPEKLSSKSRKMLSGSALRVGNLVVAAICSLLLMPFIVHHLGDRLYGFWSLAAGFIGYYGLLDFGLSGAVAQYISIAIGQRDLAECRTVFNTALRIQSLLGCVALLVTVLIAAATPWFCRSPVEAATFWKVIVILGVNAALSFPARAYGGLLDAELRFDIRSWLALLGLALRTGLIIWALLAGGGLLALAWMMLLASLPVMALQIWFAIRAAPWARLEGSAIEMKRAKSLFSYSVYTFVSTVADTLRFQVDSLVISAFVGLAAVTHYRVASVFARYYIDVIIASIGTIQPILSRLHGAKDRDSLERVFLFATKISLCISTLICLGLIGWGKPFIMRWMGAKYEDGYLPLVVLSLAVFLDVCQTPSIILLNATFEHRFYAYLNLAEGAINLLFSLILVRPLGILGVALGTLIAAFLIRIAVQPWQTCKAVGLSYGRYMRFFGGNLLGCGCLMGASIAIVGWALRPDYIYLAGSAFCATAIYAVGSWLMVLNRSEREQLLAAITNRRHKGAELAAVGAATQ